MMVPEDIIALTEPEEHLTNTQYHCDASAMSSLFSVLV